MGDIQSHHATLLAYRGSERAVVVPEGVETIGEGAFRDCDSLRIVAFPFNLERIGEEAFKGCRSLTQVIWANDAVADGLVPVLALSIYREAFADCSSLREFGASVRILSLYEDAFARCTSLTSIWFKASIYGQVDATAFMGCDALEHVRISGVDEIEDETFAGLPSLRDVVLCKVARVGKRAFADCPALKEVEISGSFKAWTRVWDQPLGDAAFENCASLERVSLPPVAPSGKHFGFKPTGVFWGCTNLLRLEVGGIGFSLAAADPSFMNTVLQITSTACLIICDGVIEGLTKEAMRAVYDWEADNYRHWGNVDGSSLDGYDHPSCVVLCEGDEYPTSRGLYAVIAIVPAHVTIRSVAEGAFRHMERVELRC